MKERDEGQIQLSELERREVRAQTNHALREALLRLDYFPDSTVAPKGVLDHMTNPNVYSDPECRAFLKNAASRVLPVVYTSESGVDDRGRFVGSEPRLFLDSNISQDPSGRSWVGKFIIDTAAKTSVVPVELTFPGEGRKPSLSVNLGVVNREQDPRWIPWGRYPDGSEGVLLLAKRRGWQGEKGTIVILPAGWNEVVGPKGEGEVETQPSSLTTLIEPEHNSDTNINSEFAASAAKARERAQNNRSQENRRQRPQRVGGRMGSWQS